MSHHTLRVLHVRVFFAAEQDPICFRGSVRSNLDPFMEYSDAAMVRKLLVGNVLTSRCTRARGDPYGLANTRCVFVARLGRSETCGVGSRGSKSIVGFSTKVWPASVSFLSAGAILVGSANRRAQPAKLYQTHVWYISTIVYSTNDGRKNEYESWCFVKTPTVCAFLYFFRVTLDM